MPTTSLELLIGDHHTIGKDMPYRFATDVPLLLRWDGHLAPGTVDKRLVSWSAPILDFIERDRVSKMFMVPAALQIVVRLPRAREVDYSRLKYILYGASPIPLDLLREALL